MRSPASIAMKTYQVIQSRYFDKNKNTKRFQRGMTCIVCGKGVANKHQNYVWSSDGGPVIDMPGFETLKDNGWFWAVGPDCLKAQPAILEFLNPHPEL